MFFGAAAILAWRRGAAAYALLTPRPRRAWMTRGAFIGVAGVAFPLVVLTALLVHVLLAEARTARATAALRIEVVGEQWWWRVHYLAADGSREFATANEIRIPVGQPVELALRTGDVIHSFWVPALAPKLDMIPGRVNRLVIGADHPGEFRGQCAEYCGGPHARMALFVIALPPAEFEAWRAQQRQPATRAASPAQQRGETAFRERGCGVCHELRGTDGEGPAAPTSLMWRAASRWARARCAWVPARSPPGSGAAST